MFQINRNINPNNNFSAKYVSNITNQPENSQKKSNAGIRMQDVLIPTLAAPVMFISENGLKDFNKRNIPKFALAIGAVTAPLVYLNHLVNKHIFNKKENKEPNIGKIAYDTASWAAGVPAMFKLGEMTNIFKDADKIKNIAGKNKIQKFVAKRPYTSYSVLGAGMGLAISVYDQFTKQKDDF